MQKIVRLIIPVIAIVLGIVAVISGVRKLANKDLYDSTVTATIVDIQEEWDHSGEDSTLIYHVYVDYEVDGVKYEHVESPEADNTMRVGDKIDLLYQSKDPTELSGKNITGNSILIIAIGAVVAVGGIIAEIKAFVGR